MVNYKKIEDYNNKVIISSDELKEVILHYAVKKYGKHGITYIGSILPIIEDNKLFFKVGFEEK